MKKFFLLSTILLAAILVQAQSYETIKTTLILHQNKKAKEDLDKAMGNSKFNSKPEAYILKSAVYSSLAVEAGTKGTPAADPLLDEAENAFKKYKEMEPSLKLLEDPTYQNVPFNIYAGLFSSGFRDYDSATKKKSTELWKQSFDKYKKVVEYSDFLIEKKIMNISTDTNSLLLAGVTAENANLKDEAAKYYSRLADKEIYSADYENFYRFLVRYYFTKKDIASFEKYRTIGKKLYPGSEFFNYDKVDFAIGMEEDFNKKLLALEETIANDPNNVKAQELLGEFIYDTLYSSREGAKQPANAADLEAKMLKAFNKTTELKPDDEYTYFLLGSHYINKRDKINEAREKLVTDIKARTKPGAPASKEDVAKRDALDAEYGNTFTAAKDPYEKAVAIYEKKPKPMSAMDIQRYKIIVGYLADIATYNKNKSKSKPADLAKWTADEKKWNDLYDEVSKMKPKPKGE